MITPLKEAIGIVGLVFATTAAAQVTFYSHPEFHGRQFSTDHTVRNMDWVGFNDRAASLVIDRGNWQMCEDADFGGRCVVLGPGEYPSLANAGLQNQISSVRPAGYGDSVRPAGYYDHRRADARLFEARVTSVHAVVGPPEQRCWVERREVQGDASVPGAIAGAVIGGILGHQIGNGTGRDVATAGGAVAGAAIGANVGRDQANVYSRDVKRCTRVTHYDHPDWWDVTYAFRGQVHHVQMTSPPGPTITVDRDGMPRG